MTLTTAVLEEIELLNLFNLDTERQGIKIHSDAAPQLIAAGRRLFDKGIISQPDGGYLTPRGHEAGEHAQALLSLLSGDAD